jgi:hypothetical protein
LHISVGLNHLSAEDVMSNWIKPGGFGLYFLFAGIVLAGNAGPTVRLNGFQALLFNSKTGAFSTDALAKSGSELGNVPSGEFASVSTFIIVKVQTAKDAPVPKNLRVRLVAIESGSMPFAAKRKQQPDRVILDQTVSLGPVNDDGFAHVGFWLPNTGCRSITLTASLVGAKAGPPMTEILPFACYE